MRYERDSLVPITEPSSDRMIGCCFKAVMLSSVYDILSDIIVSLVRSH